MGKRRKSKRSRGGRRGGSKKGSGGNRPPQFRPTVCYTHRFRFESGTNAGLYQVTRKQLLNLLLVATSAVTTTRIFEAVRLKRVEMWTNPSALGSPPVNIYVEWLGENSPSVVVADSSMGVLPARVSTSPPAMSSNRWWCMSGNQEADPLFNLSLVANTVIDVIVEVRQVEQETPTAGDVPAGATLGQVYGDYLDGITTAGLTPVGYTVIP